MSGWAPCAHSCNGRSVLHTHLPNRTGQAGRQAVTPPSLLHTWRLKDPPSPAQGLCRLTPCVNLPSHPDPADSSGGAPSVPQRKKSGFSAEWRDPSLPDPQGLPSRCEHPLVPRVPGSSSKNSCPLDGLLYSLLFIRRKIGSYAKGVGDRI